MNLWLRLCLFVLVPVLVVVGVFVWVLGVRAEEREASRPASKTEMMFYLILNEDKLTQGVMELYPQVKTVQWDWDSVDHDLTVRGSRYSVPPDRAKFVYLKGKVNHIFNSYLDITSVFDLEMKYPDIDKDGFVMTAPWAKVKGEYIYYE